MQLQAEALERETEARRQSLAADRTGLEKAAALLAENQEAYTIGGLTYTYAEVDADAHIKVKRFKEDTDLVAAREDTRSEFVGAINDTRDVLSNADVERQRLADEIDRLEIRATSLKTTSQIAAERQVGTGVSLGTAYEGIQKAVTELEHRLTKGERLLDAKKTGAVGIDYAKNETAQSGLDAIREVLQ